MSTRSGDDTATIENIGEFRQQCLENMESDDRFEGPGRPRVLPAIALWAGLLVCVLRGCGSQLAVWRLVSERRLWFFPRFPVTDQAVYKRLHSAGTKPWRDYSSRSAACWQNDCRVWYRSSWLHSPRTWCA